MARLELSLVLCGAMCLAACSDKTTESTSSSGGSGASGAGGAGGSGAAGGMGGAGGDGPCVNSIRNEEAVPDTLSATGLYSDVGSKTIASGVAAYEPQFALWTDSAVKTRWVYLPECEGVIDNSDEDNWSFPVGTRFWKQFERDGKILETRMVHRWGPGPNDFNLVVYVWTEAEDEAMRMTSGEFDVRMTEHDIPTEDDCLTCHGNGPDDGGTPSRILGFSAIQLSHDLAGVNMASLSIDGDLEVPNPTGYTVPGNQIERDALGMLHANCAHCHNGTADGVLFPVIRMRLLTTDASVEQTKSYSTLVDQDVDQFIGFGCDKFIDGGDEANSCVLLRMEARGTDVDPGNVQMPQLGTQDVDTAGVAALKAWIGALP